MKRNLPVSIFAFIALIPMLFWLVQYLDQDMWWDEMISLKDFALVKASETISTYPDPNNHILFNLINNGWTALFGERDFYFWIHHPGSLRFLQWMIALGGISYTFFVGKRFFDSSTGAIAAVLLSTTIPFLNFSMQLRGYNLSVLLTAAVLYHGWRFMRERTKIQLVMTILMGSALLYTLPSNIYFLFSFGLISAIQGLRKKTPFDGTHGVSFVKQGYFQLGLALFGTVLLALLLYSPVLDSVLHNRFVDKEPPSRGYAFTGLLWPIVSGFVSWRILLLFPLLIYIPSIRKRWIPKVDIEQQHYGRAVQLIFFFLIPFLVSFLQGNKPFERTFVPLAPIFALWWGFAIRQFMLRWETSLRSSFTLMGILSAYCLGTFFWQFSANQRIYAEALENNERLQNSYRSFYLHKGFQPAEAAQMVQQAVKDDPGTVILTDELDRVALVFYLKDLGIESWTTVKMKEAYHEKDGRSYTHAGMLQKSNLKDKDVEYANVSVSLATESEYAQKDLLPVMQMALQTTGDKRAYVLTAFPNKQNFIFNRYFQLGKVSQVGVARDFTLYKVNVN